MSVFIVFAHPLTARGDSFTAKILSAFTEGLKESGRDWEISDLYQMGFKTDMSAREYEREAYYRAELAPPKDALAEQEKILRADAIAFIYPVFWSEAPAKLVGWFDRVWTVGFAYEPRVMPTLRRADFLVCAGHTREELEASGIADAMRAVMLNDRIYDRAQKARMHIFGGTSRGQSTRDVLAAEHLARARQIGREF